MEICRLTEGKAPRLPRLTGLTSRKDEDGGGGRSVNIKYGSSGSLIDNLELPKRH